MLWIVFSYGGEMCTSEGEADRMEVELRLPSPKVVRAAGGSDALPKTFGTAHQNTSLAS